MPNSPEKLAYRRAWYQEKKAKMKAYHADYCKKNTKRVKANVKKWRDGNPDKLYASRHKYQLRKRYGITPEQKLEMYKAQNGQCLSCNFPVAMKAIHIDHNHSTGAIRGLLCRDCNLGIGFFSDSPKRLEMAAEYLRRTSCSD